MTARSDHNKSSGSCLILGRKQIEGGVPEISGILGTFISCIEYVLIQMPVLWITVGEMLYAFLMA